MRKAAIACFAVSYYTKQRILVECSQVVEEEKTDMIFGEKTEEQKRVAELTREVKELRKELLASKLDKKQVEVQMKDLKDALDEIPIEDVKRDLERLNGHLDQIFHECSIREDDPDFKFTADGLKNMAANMDKINLIMLRSELENLQALLEDTSEWRSPNFFALAYYLQHEEESKVGEMENEFRNSFLERYLEEHLMESLAMEANYAGCGEKLEHMIQHYIYA